SNDLSLCRNPVTNTRQLTAQQRNDSPLIVHTIDSCHGILVARTTCTSTNFNVFGGSLHFLTNPPYGRKGYTGHLPCLLRDTSYTPCLTKYATAPSITATTTTTTTTFTRRVMGGICPSSLVGRRVNGVCKVTCLPVFVVRG